MPDNTLPINSSPNVPSTPGGPTGAVAAQPANPLIQALSQFGAALTGQLREKREGRERTEKSAEDITSTEASQGQPVDIAAFVAAGGNPNVAQMYKEYSTEQAKKMAATSSMIDKIPGLDDQTRAMMKVATSDPKSAPLIQNIVSNLTRQAVAQTALQGRKVTAGATEQAAQTRAGAEVFGAKEKLEGVRETNATRMAIDKSQAQWKTNIAQIAAAGKGSSGANSIQKQYKAANTAYAGVLKPGTDSSPSGAYKLPEYNNSVIQALPFGNAMNVYGFTGDDDNPLPQPGVAGMAGVLFKGNEKDVGSFMSDYNQNIASLPPVQAVQSMLARLQELTAKGKVEPETAKKMMAQYIAAARLSVQNQQTNAAQGTAGAPYIPPDDDQQSEDEKHDNDPNASDEDNGSAEGDGTSDE